MKRDDAGNRDDAGRPSAGLLPSPQPSPRGRGSRGEGSSLQAGRRSRVWAALLAALVATGVLLVGGCQQFTALPALQEGLADQVTDFQAFNKAFLQWCVDEWKGNPDEAGP